MARTGMANIITRLRLMIHDPSGDDEVFSDTEIQDYLDNNIRIVLLRHLMTRDVEEKRYFVGYGDLEEYNADEGRFKVYDGWGESATEITGYTADYIGGILTFTSDQDDEYYVDAYSYNIHFAAADIFEAQAADRDNVTYFGRGGVQLGHYNLLDLARYHRRLGGAIPTKVGRTYDG